MTRSRRRLERDPLEGAGPFRFRPDDDLGPGETYTIPLREAERNGRKGYYRRFLPMDQAQITNQSDSSPLDVTYNGVHEQFIVPNAVETFDDAGIRSVAVRNAGSTAIAADEVTVELVSTPYDADDRARDRARRGPVASVVEKFTGLSPNLGGL